MGILLTESELQTWILESLGAPVVVVELTASQLALCIENAKRWFAAKKGHLRQAQVQIIAGQQDYVLPDEDIDLVTEVVFTEPGLDVASLTGQGFLMPDQTLPYRSFASPRSGGTYSHITQALQYIETSKRVLGVEQDWTYDPGTKRLSVYPYPKTGGAAIYTYKARRFTLEQLREIDHDLVKRYALAKAKEILGRIRSKREAIGATGAIQLDGQALLEESQKEVELLGEEIAKSGLPTPFLTS